MSNLEKLANLFAERTNPFHINIATGEVISASPLRIQYGDSIILDESHLVVADHVLNGYTREFDLTNVQITQLSSSDGTISFYLTGSPPSQDYTITALSLPSSTADKITATMTFKDSLKVGDRVILIPDNDFKMWYVIDKVGALNG